MHNVPRSRRLFALVAAYAIVLQALLLPLSIAAGAVADFSLCASSSATSAASPQSGAGHATGCACAAGCGMQCCAQALVGPPQSILVVAQTYAGTVTLPPALASIARPYVRGPQLARAPPVA